MDHSGKGMMSMMMSMMGALGGGASGNGTSDEEWRGQGLTTMNMNKGKSEFGILECPPASLVNRKRGAGSISASAAPATGALMTEEQAREFQRSLKRSAR